jgi:hypothetical protein
MFQPSASTPPQPQFMGPSPDELEAMQSMMRPKLFDSGVLIDIKLAVTSGTASKSRFWASAAGLKNNQDSAIISGPSSDVRISGKDTRIEIRLPPQVRATDAVTIFRTKVTKSGRQFVTNTSSRGLGAIFRVGSKDIDQQRVKLSVKKISRTNTQFGQTSVLFGLTPTKPLEPGEYIIIVNASQYYDFGVDS